MKEEALKLADELDLIARMIAIGDRIKWGQDSELMENVSVMIRRLVEEFDKLGKGDYMEGWEEGYQACKKDTAPRELSDEEILEIVESYEHTIHGFNHDVIDFARMILKKASEK